MPAPLPRSFALIGPGRAGGALALALGASGVRCVGVAGRSPAAPSVIAWADRLGAPARAVSDVGRGAELVIVAVPDDAIAVVARDAVSAMEAGALMIHCSGLTPLTALPVDELAARGAAAGALHPLQTFPDADTGRRRLTGAAAAIAGDARVETIARHLGLAPFPIIDADRPRYHAAACVASNHLVVLLAQVESLARGVGAPATAFGPLVAATIANLESLGARAALTGPVARGDVATVTQHLAALDAADRALYVPLALGALALAAHPAPAMRELLEAAR